MSTTEHDDLEQELSAMTRWEGESPGLWRTALDAAERGESHSAPAVRFRPGLRFAAIIAVGLIATTGALVILENVGRSHDLALSMPSADKDATSSARVPQSFDVYPGRRPQGQPELLDLGGGMDGAGMGGGGVPAADRPAMDMQSLWPTMGPAIERQVVRKATIELETDDVATAFLKASQIPSAAHGEFVESSSLTGSGDAARAHLKLRVAADRLSETFNVLRALGAVRSEELQGDDVTGQVVDLDARLRNEQRVEGELLELLESRSEAPLKDILEMRRQINDVRQSIERLTAQRDNLRRLVDLATILVIIRPDDAPPEEVEGGLGGYFLERMDGAWTAGLRFLTDSLAGGIRVLVGGLLMWVVLAVGVLAWRHHRRQTGTPMISPAQS